MPLWLVLAALWTLAILIGCALPGNSMPGSPIWSFDKAIHLTLFGGFGLLWMHALRWPVGKRALWVVVAGLGFAIGTEVVQGFAPGRSPEVLDAVADVAGVALGVGLYLLWQRRAVPQA